MFSGQKKIVSVLVSIGTKKLKIRVRKLSISLLFLFFRSKKANHLESIVVEEEKLPCLLYLIQVF